MPYTFSKESEALLTKLHPAMVLIVRRAMAYQFMDMKVISVLRTQAEQAVKVSTGVSATTKSKHLPDADGYSRAIDLAPFPIDWNDRKRFGALMGLMAAAAEDVYERPWREVIRLGGNWDGDNDFNDNKPEDPGHIELVGLPQLPVKATVCKVCKS